LRAESGPELTKEVLFVFTPAFAQTAGAAPSAGDMIAQFAPFLLILIIMYFLLIRPQQRRAKEHAALISGIRRGDTIVMNNGMIGKVSKVFEEQGELEVEIADNVKVRVVRGMVADVRNKTEPAPAAKA
jgi:preprotein translocase subunit YajC